jgi:hypothetical protein
MKLIGNIVFVGNYARPQTNALPARATRNVAAAQPPPKTIPKVATNRTARVTTNQPPKVAASQPQKKK